MSYSNGKITAPVSVNDVQRALGSSSADVGTLCTNEHINMWSKCKPVRLNMLDTVTGQWDATAQDWLSSATWFMGNPNENEAGYGWRPVIGTAGALATLFANYAYSTTVNTKHHNGWVAELPQGKSGAYRSPYRLTDFVGYNHQANTPPEKLSCDTEIVVSTNTDFKTRIHPTYIKRASDDLNITARDYIIPKDILQKIWGTLDTIYTGFAIVSEDFSSVRCLTTDSMMELDSSDVGDSSSTSSMLVDGRFYWICPFFTQTAHSGKRLTPISSARFSTFPMMTPVLAKVTKSSQALPHVSATLTATLQWTGTEYNLVCDFSLTDTDNTSFDLTRVTLSVFYGSSESSLATHNFGDVHLDSSHPTYSNSYTFVVHDTNLRVKLIANATVIKTVVPLMPRD